MTERTEITLNIHFNQVKTELTGSIFNKLPVYMMPVWFSKRLPFHSRRQMPLPGDHPLKCMEASMCCQGWPRSKICLQTNCPWSCLHLHVLSGLPCTKIVLQTDYCLWSCSSQP